MSILQAYASASARRHMLRDHGVEWYEVLEVLASGPRFVRGKSAGSERRYRVVGRTQSGRRLRIVFRLRQNGDAQVITAFEEPR